jgi:hypothetical protein
MITKLDVQKAMVIIKYNRYIQDDLKQIIMALKLYKERGEYNETYNSAVACLKLAGYEIKEG